MRPSAHFGCFDVPRQVPTISGALSRQSSAGVRTINTSGVKIHEDVPCLPLIHKGCPETFDSKTVRQPGDGAGCMLACSLSQRLADRAELSPRETAIRA